MAHDAHKAYGDSNRLFENRLYNAKEAAAVLRVSVKTVHRWVQERKLPALRVGPRNLAIWGHELDKMVGAAYQLECRGGS